jgi:hypothetical protein
MKITAVGDPPGWLRDTPLSTNVGTNFPYKRRSLGRVRSRIQPAEFVHLLCLKTTYVQFPRVSIHEGELLPASVSERDAKETVPTDRALCVSTVETTVTCGKGLFCVIEGVYDNATTVGTVERDFTGSVGYPNMNPSLQLQRRIWLGLISHSAEQTHGTSKRTAGSVCEWFSGCTGWCQTYWDVKTAPAIKQTNIH